jgi:hypothetical protein
MSNFFIPKRINVGFQDRSDTYTGKLAYIIYFDAKNKLRKETSWNGWRNENLGNEIYDNEPTSGFVLNKKVGDYVAYWNHRQAYVRIYDPRGFEFEITISNLLYILENATSTKGKGLEGDFVYGWDGKDLVLIPCEAPDYVELVKLNELRHSDKKITAKQLKIGGTYRSRENQELIYMGKYDEYKYGKTKKAKPQFWFYQRGEYGYFHTMATVGGKLVEVISEEAVEDYAELFEKMESRSDYSPIKEEATVYQPYTFEEFEKKFENNRHWCSVFTEFDNVDGRFERQSIGLNHNNKYYYYKRELVERKTGYYSWNQKTEMVVQSVCKYVDTLKEVFDAIKPCRKLQYLENGKFYGEATY